MQETLNKLEDLLRTVPAYFAGSAAEVIEFKSAPEKWSQKEIPGHLADSAINNLQSFNEIQYEPKPYRIRQYKQDDLVKSNDYQHRDIQQILQLWIALNKQIMWIIKLQTSKTLSYEIIIGSSENKTLKWLMTDYVNHMEHHVKQFNAGNS